MILWGLIMEFLRFEELRIMVFWVFKLWCSKHLKIVKFWKFDEYYFFQTPEAVKLFQLFKKYHTKVLRYSFQFFYTKKEELWNLVFWGFENFAVLRIWRLCSSEVSRSIVFWGFEDLIIMVFWGFQNYRLLRIWGLWRSEDLRILLFWGFEDFALLEIWGLWCSEDLRILLFRGFEDYDVLGISGLWSSEHLKVLLL